MVRVGRTTTPGFDFDRPRDLPAGLTDRWIADGRWRSETVTDVLAGTAWRPDALACVVEDRRFTFAELTSWSIAVACLMRNSGVGPGDRVLIQLPNCAEHLVAVHAAWLAGAIAVPVLPMLRDHELRGMVAAVGPSAVIGATTRGQRRPTAELDAALGAGADSVVRLCIGVGVGADAEGWSRLPECAAGAGHFAAADLPGHTDPGACVLVLFTSGTTSEPKAVRHDSRSLLAEIDSYRRAADLGTADAVFNPAPVAHIGALVITTLVPWALGAPVVLLDSWDADRALHVIAREAVTFAVGAPVFLQELLDLYETPGYDGHRVRRFHTGAAPTAEVLLGRAEAAGVIAWRAWGMTEAPTISYGCACDPLFRRAGFDGRVEPGSEVIAVDEHGGFLEPGTEGELWLRSPKQTMGYLDQTAWTDGWLHTGDIGIVDDEDWVLITGRTKDIINRGGEKFSARAVEDAICRHPAIATAAVLGVPEPRLGEQVVAFVTLRSGHDDPGLPGIIDHLTGLRIAAQKFPVSVTVLDALPVTPTGKVAKRVLAQSWEDR